MGQEGAPKFFSLSPFDSAHFAALTEGLEVSILPLSSLGDGNPALRLDAEFFGRANLTALTRVRQHSPDLLADLVTRIQHPMEVTREYADEGVQTLMAGNIRPNRADSSNLPRMLIDADTVSRNLLQQNDVILVRTGANYGTVASWKGGNDVYSCADLLVARSPNAPSGFISSFLNSKYGLPLVKRCSYGSAQPHISPAYVGLIPIPRLGGVEAAVDRLVDEAVEAEQHAGAKLADASYHLLEALGLTDWSPPEPLTYTRSAAIVFAAGRLDAEFAAPRIQLLLDRLGRSGMTIDMVADVRREKFRGRPPGTFRYMEIGDLDGFGRCASTELEIADAPSRAAWHVRAGDVLTSTVRPIRRLSAIVAPDQDANVCSSGFVVLKPSRISPELLLTYLRLPLVAELLHLLATASMYPALAERDLLALPMPAIAPEVDDSVRASVREAREGLTRSENLLAAAARAIEIAIEHSEAAGLAFIAEQEAANASAN